MALSIERDSRLAKHLNHREHREQREEKSPITTPNAQNGQSCVLCVLCVPRVSMFYQNMKSTDRLSKTLSLSRLDPLRLSVGGLLAGDALHELLQVQA